MLIFFAVDKLEPVVDTAVVVVGAVGRRSFLSSFNGRVVVVVETVTKMLTIAGYFSRHHDAIVFQSGGQLGWNEIWKKKKKKYSSWVNAIISKLGHWK